MTTNQDAISIVSQALSHLGLQPPNSETESLSITLQDNTVIRIDVVNEGKRVCLWNEFMPWPDPEVEATVLENLLRLHALGTATDGASFAAKRETGSIIVFKSFPTAHLTADWLTEELESLVDLIFKAREVAATGRLNGADGSTDTDLADLSSLV
ncbi:type III secretion system chaperone [Verrucomicrobium sp. BvORR106]|uniref:type III secretion system chaperone n=1 Tax=Verrucomicrobium sp. BvORR106 TaxID=1403819 RepID=UPI00056E38B1|nr:type III secretion system chaperone [Verrucomicrobium sp. BvORR106]